jgi:diacylglycerol kinase
MTRFSYRKFFRSFGHAWRGLVRLIQTEQNARVHFVAAVILGMSTIIFGLSRLEVAILFFAVVLVFAIEIINTAVEKLLDVVHPESHATIGYVKDALAGAVLIAAIIAIVVAFLVFYPHVRDLVSAL